MLVILVSISCVFLDGISAVWFDNSITTEDPSDISTNSETTTYDWTIGRYGHIPIRLNGGSRGSLMLYYNGRWGYVCYSSHQRAYQFDSVCRYLGFSSAYSISQYYESKPAIVKDFLCPGYSNSNGVDGCTGRNFGSNTYCTYKLYIECDSSPITTEESVTTSLYSVDTSGSYTNVRLVGGNYYWEGRVEIYHNGAWGTICDDNFDTNEAKVICTMLGYNRYGSVTAYGSAAFGEGRGSIMLDDLQCNGYESDISHCASNGWNHHNCGHGEDASVSCRYPKSGGNSITTYSVTTEESATTLQSVETSGSYTNVRLVGGNYYWEGRVEIYHNGVWGTICDDDFDTNEAKVICTMLGYNRYGSVTAYGNAAFGEGSGSIMLDDLNCNGYESDISQCSPRRWNHHNCGHSEDASVSCRYPKSGGRNEMTTVSFLDRATTADVLGRHGHISFRLTNGGYGLLEIYYKGRWGYVCHNYNQQREEFNSACRYLGYSSAVRINGQYDRSHSAIVTDFHCPRSYYYYFLFPNGIDDCTGSRLGYSNYCNDKLYIECGTYVDATTVEYEVTTAGVLGTHGHIPVRLTYGGEGYLQIYYNGRWGYVCHNSSQSTYQFNSVCRYLGYSSAHYVYGRYDSSHTALVTDLQCPGSYYYYSSSNGIDDCTGDRLGYTTYCNDKLYIQCDTVTTEETATVPFKTESTNARHITVNCQHSSWYVKVHLPPMEQQYSDFKETDIYLGSHSCTGTRSGDYLIFNEDYTTCGTNKIASANGVIYTNTLVYAVHDPNQPYIVHEYRFQVSVECDMSKQESGENNINNIHGNLEQQTISGVGHFVVQLKFFSDSNFQHEFNGFPPSYMVGQNVYVKATTPIHDYNVKMRLSDCYTKPSKSASDSYIYYLIKNGCPATPSAFITTKSTHETRFHFQDFEYAFHPDSMYVHCNATFCHSNDYSRDCEPRCSNRKRVGSIDQDDEPIEGVGPIGYAEDEATVVFQKGTEALHAGKKPEVNNKGNNPVYVVGVVVVAVSMVAVSVVMSIYFRSKRRQNGQAKIV
ncbi:deleted in malignant brain tumors 1 protein-like [Mytilus trossulus]|uniref:deleted in malignant brain tumors 1 protein-like n=1 Tax=Mytilus trossulus TaxID=6551 RepID=UPI003006515D